jgi:hypothetical protein
MGKLKDTLKRKLGRGEDPSTPDAIPAPEVGGSEGTEKYSNEPKHNEVHATEDKFSDLHLAGMFLTV